MENGWVDTAPESQIMTLDRLFSGEQAWGIYRIHSAFEQSTLEKLAKANDFAFYVLDGRQITSKADFLTRIQEVIPFEEKFDINWDAFTDVLVGIYKTQSKGVIILYTDFQNFMRENRKAFDIALDILNDLTHGYVDRVTKRGIHLLPLYILLQTNADVDLLIEKLASDD